MIIVTGGAGFSGTNFVLDWLREVGTPVLNLDKLTYAGNLESLASLDGDARHVFVRGDVRDRALLDRLLVEHRPRAVVPFAAESHVDRSHDQRYAIDARKIERELGWRPAETFDSGIRKTVRWHLDQQGWVDRVQSGAYREWVAKNYAER